MAEKKPNRKAFTDIVPRDALPSPSPRSCYPAAMSNSVMIYTRKHNKTKQDQTKQCDDIPESTTKQNKTKSNGVIIYQKTQKTRTGPSQTV